MQQLARRAAACGAAGLLALAPAVAGAQAVTVDGPAGDPLTTLTPRFTIRLLGFAGPPYTIRLQVAGTTDFAAPLAADTSVVAMDSVLVVQLTRPLPSAGTVYWRALAATEGGVASISAATGPRRVPSWLELLSPNSPNGDVFDIRRPLFTWRSAAIAPAVGPWRYEVEILSNGRLVQRASGVQDTVFRAVADLEANAFYRWAVRASLPSGESIRVTSRASFFIDDPPLPRSTLFYQNFPNPFPTPSSFTTCFWFDIGEARTPVSLSILDLRGQLVKRVIPTADGITAFDPGRYGRGTPGAGSNCSNQYVWDGTDQDGRLVAPGVYLARFQAGGAPEVRRIVFRGR